MGPAQANLFDPPAPDGFSHTPELLTVEAEAELVRQLSELPLQAFRFHGFEGKRRVASFGWRYDFNTAAFERATPFPDWLEDLRRAAARFGGVEAEALEHALVTEYPAGATYRLAQGPAGVR
jgi:alkylated DNA repair dioxygenase AlkB